MGEAELEGVCFRFASDLSLVCFERKVRCIADFLHECCVVHGVADIEIANHTLIAKYYATDTFVCHQFQSVQTIIAGSPSCFDACLVLHMWQENSEAEPVPVPYRYDISPGRSGVCNVFIPNMLGSSDSETARCGHVSEFFHLEPFHEATLCEQI